MKSKSLKVFVKGLIFVGAAFAMAACDDVTKPDAIESAADGLVQEEDGEGGQVQKDQEKTGKNGKQGETDIGASGSQNTGLGESSSSEAPEQGGSSSDGAGVESSSSEAVEEGIFLANDTEEEKNFMEVSYTENVEPCVYDRDNNRNLCQILAYPKRLSDTKKHGVVVWGPGGGTDPKDYGGIIKRLASHGFVVVALRQSPGGGALVTEVLDWLDKKNKTQGDPLYGKLDMTKVGCSGHSMGGLESERAVIKDNRVITAFLNNSGAWDDPGANQVPTNKSIAILYGEGGMERGNAENDYNRSDVRAPACLIEMTGGTGTECYDVTPWQKECGWGHGSGSWAGMAATISWMRWHLGGEDWRKDDFVGSSGKYINGPIIGAEGHWKGTCKNF